VAAADYFQDRVEEASKQFGIHAQRCYTGLSGYRRLLEGQLDAVAIMSPPYFHPEQATAAVAAGKHVYLAKPVAVDVPGCLDILTAGSKATDAGKCFLVDFQTRNNAFYREAVRRINAGDLGELICGQANYHAGRLYPKAPGDDKSAESRLRNWVFDKALSGDILVEQNVHALDVASWVLDANPLRAFGTGGRRARTDVGDCWDHFTVTVWLPNDFILDFSSTQFLKGYSDIGCRLYGTRGTFDSHYGGDVWIRGERSYPGGNTRPIYTEGAVNNVKDFRQSVDTGDSANATVAPSVRSTLTCILGRQAAYRGSEVTWQTMMEQAERIDGRLAGLKD